MARHNIFGHKGEELAFETLLKQGYTIRERNWRFGKNEIDIIAEKDNRIIIVEVKTRNNEIDDISKVITPKKVSHLIEGARAYLSYCKLDKELQFDIILLTGTEDNLQIEHIPDAIMPPLKTY